MLVFVWAVCGLFAGRTRLVVCWARCRWRAACRAKVGLEVVAQMGTVCVEEWEACGVLFRPTGRIL